MWDESVEMKSNGPAVTPREPHLQTGMSVPGISGAGLRLPAYTLATGEPAP